jgi:IS30 family transposase
LLFHFKTMQQERQATGAPAFIYFADPRSIWQLKVSENQNGSDRCDFPQRVETQNIL